MSSEESKRFLGQTRRGKVTDGNAGDEKKVVKGEGGIVGIS